MEAYNYDADRMLTSSIADLYSSGFGHQRQLVNIDICPGHVCLPFVYADASSSR